MTTGKDKSGKYHPPKGKPSGSPQKQNENLGADEIKNEAGDVVDEQGLQTTHIQHPNRQTSKTPEEKDTEEL